MSDQICRITDFAKSELNLQNQLFLERISFEVMIKIDITNRNPNRNPNPNPNPNF